MKQKNKLDDFISTNSYCGKYIRTRFEDYCVYNHHKHIEWLLCLQSSQAYRVRAYMIQVHNNDIS